MLIRALLAFPQRWDLRLCIICTCMLCDQLVWMVCCSSRIVRGSVTTMTACQQHPRAAIADEFVAVPPSSSRISLRRHALHPTVF